MNLTPQQRDALAQLSGGEHQTSTDHDVIVELMQLGLLEERAGAIGLTQKGAVEKVMMRSQRRVH